MKVSQHAKRRVSKSLGFLLSNLKTKKFVLTAAMSVFALSMSGGGGSGSGSGNVSQPKQSGQGSELPFVLKSRSVFAVTMPSSSLLSIMSTSTAVPISVVNAPNSSMTVDVSGFRAPSITNAVLKFGSIRITGLDDNNLTVCGTNCQTACLTSAAAAEMQTVTIGANKQHAVVTADLTPIPSYSTSSDFTNAGAGCITQHWLWNTACANQRFNRVVVFKTFY